MVSHVMVVTSKYTYNAFCLSSCWGVDANVETSIRFAPGSVQVSCFTSFVLGVFHEEIPIHISNSSTTFKNKHAVKHTIVSLDHFPQR
jgi:hypothetical protein